MVSHFSLTLWLLLAGGAPNAVGCFQLPKIKFVGISANKEGVNAPQRLIRNGPEEAESLRRRLEEYCGIAGQRNLPNISFCWEPQIKESYEVADVIFREVARASHDRYSENTYYGDSILAFPSMAQPEHLEKLASVLQSDKCEELLGLESACAELYPSSPAPYLRMSYAPINVESEDVNAQDAQNIPTNNPQSATENWVKNFLGKYRLCPYTSSPSRAAVGLSSVGVPVGAVHVRVASTTVESTGQQSDDVLRAADLVSSFWSEVVTLMHSPEEEWATSLVVYPEYDDEFESFVDICDSIVEPTVVATQATKFIGRAWFHPQYDADAVGHSEVIAGHAVPHKMVEGFMQSLHPSDATDDQGLEYHELAKANNQVRKTPHATINILRRSQLNAAAEYEKGLGAKRPKANSIYVRNAVRLSGKEL